MSGQKRILLVSRDLMVLQTRKLMLGAYFDVSAAGRVLEAKLALAKQSFDLVVLCYTLTGDDSRAVVDAVRKSCPQAKILMLTVNEPTASGEAFHPYFLSAEEGPFTLVKKSAQLLGFELGRKGRMVPAQPGVFAAPSTA